MISAEKLKEINKELDSIPVGKKNYVMVNKRIEGFRQLVPEGTITTEIIRDDGNAVVMKATIMDENGKILSTGLAREDQDSSFINKTSYIENCETSAVGRALGFLGIGVDGSMASAEEVANAITQQNQNSKKETKKQSNKKEVAQQKIDAIKVKIIKDDIEAGVIPEQGILATFKITKIEDMTEEQFRKYAAQKQKKDTQKKQEDKKDE